MTRALPSWPEIAAENPGLRDRLRADRTDHDALVEYLCLTLGATVVSATVNDSAQ